MSKKSRVENLEQSLRTGDKRMVVYWMDLHDDNLYHLSSRRNDEEPLTRAEAEAEIEQYEKQGDDLMVLWVDYDRDWRGSDEQK